LAPPLGGIHLKILLLSGNGLHNAAERIRANYEDVDKLIAAVKASVVKNKDRRAKFSAINTSPASRSH